MHLCLGRLGWTPAALWRATPREVAAALAPPPAAGPAGGGHHGRIDRTRLDALMRRYPDAAPAAGMPGPPRRADGRAGGGGQEDRNDGQG